MLTKIHDRLYLYKSTNGTLYKLDLGEIGICGYGLCWRLRMQNKANTNLIACMVTKSDGGTGVDDIVAKYSLDNKMWTDDEAIEKAESLVRSIEAVQNIKN